MTRFSLGRNDYEIVLSIQALREIKSKLRVDLYYPAGGDQLVALLLNLGGLADVLWAVCAAQAKAFGVTREQFDGELNGDTLYAGWRALVDAYAAFAPADRRAVVLEVIERQATAMDRAADAAAEVLRSAEYGVKVDEIIDGAKAEMLSLLS